MLSRAWPYLRGVLHSVDPEKAHEMTLMGLEYAPVPACRLKDKRLHTSAFGLTFPNPVGVAAGFDKDARVPNAMHRLGFGFAEVGTVTPRPQSGNPLPRVFRLAEDEAVINRLGFNNGGFDAAYRRLEKRDRSSGIVGVNVGANKDSEDKIADYVAGVSRFAPLADYLTINISSPNTPNLRDLQTRENLDELLARVLEAREQALATGGVRTPVLVKIAPDLSLEELDAITEVVRQRAADGLIVSNTTVSRPPQLVNPKAQTIGGLSGAPVFQLSTFMLAQAAQRLEGAMPLIGVGGVNSGEAALAKIRAGATLVQLYTGMIYHGPMLASHINAFLLEHLESHNLDSLASEIGKDTAAICAGSEAFAVAQE